MADFIQPGPVLANPFAADPLLQAYLRWRLPSDLQEDLAPGLLAFGGRMLEEVQDLGLQAEAHPPRHVPFGPWGDRIDQIELSGAWKRLQDIAAEEGLVALAYERADGEFSRLHQFARLYLFHPDSAWLTAPLSLTDGAARVLELHGGAALREQVLPRLTSRNPAEFWTAGQWMTEREGGSDMGRTSTTARRHGHGGARPRPGMPPMDWQLHGSKWFTTATASPMALALARAEGAPEGSDGLSLFYVEVFDEDGRLRDIRVDRLKPTLGMRALPTAELTLDGTPALLVGEKGHGVRKLASMLNLTRIHGSLYAVASMRRALALAKDFAARRRAFGRPLLEQPLHAETLAALQVEWEGCFHLAFHLGLLLGRQEAGPAGRGEAAILRLLTPAAKLYTGKQAVAAVCEAAEAFGGAGYVEDTGIPTLVRDTMALPVWEGTTNVLSLDVLRAMDRDAAFPPLYEDVRSRLDGVRADGLEEGVRRVRRAMDHLREAESRIDSGDAAHAEAQARAFAFGLARAYAGSLLLEHASWLASRPAASGHARAAPPGYARAAQVALRWCRQPMADLPAADAAHRAATRDILAEKA
jgi:alkylation response protein AidB-like acyl-CoA dehydrogenase